MKLRMKYWSSALALAVVVVALLGPTMAYARNANPGVFPINSRPYGLTYGQWSARWWQYAFQQTTLDICATDKPGSQVIFLAGNSAINSCTVPSGKAIMFPIFNVEWSVAEAEKQPQFTPGQSCFVPAEPNGTTDATFPNASLEADVDGVTLQNLTDYRAVSAPFTFTTVEGNPFGLCPADGPCPLTSRAVADGFWIMLMPLSPGAHTIHFTATVPFPEYGDLKYTADTTYHLTVQPGH